jgi:hypothetical protein
MWSETEYLSLAYCRLDLPLIPLAIVSKNRSEPCIGVSIGVIGVFFIPALFCGSTIMVTSLSLYNEWIDEKV